MLIIYWFIILFPCILYIRVYFYNEVIIDVVVDRFTTAVGNLQLPASLVALLRNRYTQKFCSYQTPKDYLDSSKDQVHANSQFKMEYKCFTYS